MKTTHLFILSIVLGTFLQCKNPPKDDSEELKYGHFHSCAGKIDRGFKAILKVPDEISDRDVYLTKINFIDRDTVSPENTPHPGRREILLADLSFSTNMDDELDMVEENSYVWDKECKTITFKSSQSEDVIDEIKIASIFLNPIPGIDEIYFDDREKHPEDDPCLEFFNNCKTKDVMTHEHRSGFIFFHPGHEVGDPRSGHDGIPIGNEGP